ncbi:MAG: NAD(P)/FAD-dependent oxidoreductase [Novosphingobium sp.]|nr:NAD(P)/FAD-dependent oxidoreductase [Novosphingobium sp.]
MAKAKDEYASISNEIREFVGGADIDLDELRQKYAAERDLRMRKDANDQYIEPVADFAHYVDDPYIESRIAREPIDAEHDVLVIGAGWAGLLIGAELRKVGVEDIRYIEKGGDFGGTWYWNRYPGIMCDTESYIYMPLLEELGYVPSRKYAYGDEIREYMQNVARHFDLYRAASFQTKATGATWNEARARWIVTTDRGDRFAARFLAVANGLLEKPKLPAIPGIRNFKGHTFHSSRWDFDYTGGDEHGDLGGLRGKHVGIVGTGATAIQIIPHLGEWAEKLYVFQRTPAAVGVRGNRETSPEFKASLKPGWQNERRDNFNAVFAGANVEDLVDDGFSRIGRLMDHSARWAAPQLGRTPSEVEGKYIVEMLDAQLMEDIRRRVTETVRDPRTAEALKPWHRRWCKRPQFHDEYLETFNRPNVTLVDTHGAGVERMTENGAVVEGVEYRLDCLIFASGFETGTSMAHRAGYDITGRNGVTLSDHWADGMKTLHGMMSNGFPNLFVNTFGQNASSVNFSGMLHENARHISYVIAKAFKERVRKLQPSQTAVDEYVRSASPMSVIENEYWRSCTPSYFNGEGDTQNKTGFFANTFALGEEAFLRILADWRAEDTFAGMEITFD